MRVFRYRGRSAGRGPVWSPGCSVLAGVVLLVFGTEARLESQVLINEVLAANESTPPEDVGGGFPDMVELYNASPEAVVLGADTDSASYYLSDECLSDSGDGECSFPEGKRSAWRFPPGTVIQPGGHLVIFCDESVTQGLCELHASFQIENNGSEPVILWGPEDGNGVRPIADRVFLPPLAADVSFGRFPDGAGGPNVALEDTFNVFVHSAKERGTFGSCVSTQQPCRGGGTGTQRDCLGAENSGPGKFSPEVKLVDFSTNAPNESEPVDLWVEVRDDLKPDESDITLMNLRYAVQSGPEQPIGQQQVVKMTFEDLHDRSEEGRPLAFFSVWRGQIPPQPAGSIVRFKFEVGDVEETPLGEDPDEQCCPGSIGSCNTGPCNDLGLPGTDWHADSWRECEEDNKNPLAFEDCNVPYRYRVAHEPSRPELRRLVINEIAPWQTRHIDTTDNNPEDYIELYNGSGVEIDLGGLWLSDRPFAPQGNKQDGGTPFPEGATIAPDQYLIVWLDNDGYRCPSGTTDPNDLDPDDPQKCPDPTDPSKDRYHTNFGLNREGDQIYLFDRLEDGLGLIHGYRFGAVPIQNLAFALCPNGSPSGRFVLENITAEIPNGCATVEASFIRGDVDANCNVNITDAVFLLQHLFASGADPSCPDAADVDDNGTMNVTDAVYLLNYQFAGGPDPIDPGPACPGLDPTDDGLPECAQTVCSCTQ